jgi:hypothetical protein
MHKGRYLRLLVLAGLGFAILVSLVPYARASVGLLRFGAIPQADISILVSWETAFELGTVAFNLYRATTVNGPWTVPISTQPGAGDMVAGASYTYRDTQVTPGFRYYYLLEEITVSGPGERFGPVNAGVALPPRLTLTPTSTATLWPIPTPSLTATERPTATRNPTNTITRRSLFLPIILRR